MTASEEALAKLKLPSSLHDPGSETGWAPGVLEAARILEQCVARLLSTGREPPAAMWKNLGLAYAKVVQKHLPCDE